MSSIKDIKQLPDLYRKKDEWEMEIGRKEEESLRLDKEAEESVRKAKDEFLRLDKEAEESIQRERAKLKRFDDVLACFKKNSRDWWMEFYSTNSPSKLDGKIQNLSFQIRQAQQKVEACNQIDNSDFSLNIRALSLEVASRDKIREEFSELAGYVSRKALCYGVCAYADKSGWTLRRFNPPKDWGLHLCPNGAGSSIYKIWFAITNPLGFWDIKKAIRPLPAKYVKMLSLVESVQASIKKYRLKNDRDPVGEMNALLRQARSEKATASENIGKWDKERAYLQKLRAIVGADLEKFMVQKFDDKLLYDFREDYRNEMMRRISRMSDYEAHKDLCRELVMNVFDFKNSNLFVEGKRARLQQAIDAAPKEARRKKAEVERQLLDAQRDTQRKKARVEQEMKNAQSEYERVREKIKQTQADYKNILTEMTKQDPASTFFYQADGWINQDLAIKQIEKMAEKRTRLEKLPVYEYLDLGGVKKPFLSEIEWQTNVDNAVNLVSYPLSEDTKPDAALWAASNLITVILLSMPIRKVHFTFIDFGTEGIYSKLLSRLNRLGNLYSVVHNSNQLTKIKDIYLERTKMAENTITEVVVWTDCISDDSVAIKEQIKSILQNGAKYGYYTIAVPLNKGVVGDKAKQESEKMLKDYHFRSVFAPGEDFYSDRTEFIKSAETYILNHTETKKAESICLDYIPQKPTNVEKEGLIIPIGRDERGSEMFYRFSADSDSPHTFILGGSGSGKSYLLQNILLNGMLKYKPESLELYVMDFKKGGTEFYVYKDLPPHISHLLVDDADHQAVYEILNNLNKKMDERGRMIRNGDHGNIANYNEAHPDRPMPYIMLVVDECHKLFESDPAERKMQDDINATILNIAKEGRSQGITFVFATQTFAGMKMPAEIKELIGNRFLMKVNNNEDANKLFDGGSFKNSYLSQGFAYHETTKSFVHIYDYKKGLLDKNARELIDRQKRIEGRLNYVFSGNDVWSLPMVGDTGKDYPIAYIGKSVSVERDDIKVPMKRQTGNNILITGINEDKMLQSERVFFSAALSLAQQTFNGKRARISIFDNPGSQDDNFKYRKAVFEKLESLGNVHIFRKDEERLKEMGRLGNVVRSKNPEDVVNILLILSQERCRSLLRKKLPVIEQEPAPMSQIPPASEGSLDDWEKIKEMTKRKDELHLPECFGQFSPPSARTTQQACSSNATMQDELQFILSEGGESDVHIIMQVNTPNNIFQNSDAVHRNDIQDWFNYIVILKSSQDVLGKLPASDIRPDRLNSNPDLLRAIYVNQEIYQNQMFTPFQFPKF